VVTGCNQVDNNTTAAHLPASIACLLPQDPVQLSHDITRATVTNQRQASIQHISAIQDIDGDPSTREQVILNDDLSCHNLHQRQRGRRHRAGAYTLERNDIHVTMFQFWAKSVDTNVLKKLGNLAENFNIATIGLSD